ITARRAYRKAPNRLPIRPPIPPSRPSSCSSARAKLPLERARLRGSGAGLFELAGLPQRESQVLKRLAVLRSELRRFGQGSDRRIGALADERDRAQCVPRLGVIGR